MIMIRIKILGVCWDATADCGILPLPPHVSQAFLLWSAMPFTLPALGFAYHAPEPYIVDTATLEIRHGKHLGGLEASKDQSAKAALARFGSTEVGLRYAAARASV